MPFQILTALVEHNLVTVTEPTPQQALTLVAAFRKALDDARAERAREDEGAEGDDGAGDDSEHDENVEEVVVEPSAPFTPGIVELPDTEA
jgi:hypothetical protein